MKKVKNLLDIKNNLIIMLIDESTCVYDGTVKKVPSELLNKVVEHYYQFGNNHLRIILEKEEL